MSDEPPGWVAELLNRIDDFARESRTSFADLRRELNDKFKDYVSREAFDAIQDRRDEHASKFETALQAEREERKQADDENERALADAEALWASKESQHRADQRRVWGAVWGFGGTILAGVLVVIIAHVWGY